MPTETLRPNGVGDNSELAPFGDAPNWKCVDEAVSDGDTTYVYSSASDTGIYLDLYNIDASAIPPGSTINSVTVYIRVRSRSAICRADFRAALKKSGGVTQYGALRNPSTAYTLYNDAFVGIAQPDLDTLQIGVEITSCDADPIFYVGRCTQIYVVIDYTEPVVGEARGDGYYFLDTG